MNGLTIIIPTYKRTDSLKRLLQTLKMQTIAQSLEVLVIDQNAKGFLEREIGQAWLYNATYVWSEKPNASLARNLGAKLAANDCLLFIDDDLVPEADFCERGMQFFKKNSFIECFAPWIKNSPDDLDGTASVRKKILSQVNSNLFLISDTISAAFFMRKPSFIKSGGFDVVFFDFAKTAEDQEFFLRLGSLKIKLYYTFEFSIYHDENQAGGCELRTADYWTTREKLMKAWVFRHKIKQADLKLTIPDYVSLYRSVFFNRVGLSAGIANMLMQIRLFRKVVNETNIFLDGHKSLYSAYPKIDHLASA